MDNATDSGNTPKGLTLDEAFAQLKASRGQAPDVEQLEDEDGVDVVDEDLDDDNDEDFDTDVDDEGDEDDSEGDDSEDGDEDESDSEGDDEEDEVFEIEIDGELVEVSAEELHKGYLRQNDYTRKRQADAKRAKDLEAEYEGKLSQLNQALQQNVSDDQRRLVQLQQQYAKSTDDGDKRNLHYQMLQLQQNIGTRQQALAQANELQKRNAQAKAEAYWKEQEEILVTQFEDWDTKKDELMAYLQGEGFEDLSMFAHASMATLVDKAKQFDELQQKRKSVAKKKIRRKVPNVLKRGQGEKTFNLDQSKIKKLEARFAKTGNIKDAMALQKAKRGK